MNSESTRVTAGRMAGRMSGCSLGERLSPALLANDRARISRYVPPNPTFPGPNVFLSLSRPTIPLCRSSAPKQPTGPSGSGA